MPPRLEIRLLGEFCLLVDGQPCNKLNRPRQQALVACLLLNRRAPQSRQHLAFSFWPDSTESQAHTNLRKLFFQLRQAFPDADRYLFANSHEIGWRPDAAYSLDAAEVEYLLERLEQEATFTVDAVQRVCELYAGELLPDCYDDWLLTLRSTLHERVVGVLERALVTLEARHEYDAGLRTARHLLRLDPLHEAASRHVMHFRALLGDRAGALRAYHKCASALAQELEVEPSPETQALYRRLLANEVQPANSAAASLAGRQVHVPMVGRTAEWQTLRQASSETMHRGPLMVVVWGEAGMGKTRLVEEFAHWANLRPGSVASARAYAAEGALSYGLLTEWFRSEALRPGLEQLEGVWLTELARLLPELLVAHPALSPPMPMLESWQYRRFYEALARAVLAAPRPCTLILEDLQWCDAETLGWLRYLMRHDLHAPLLVIGTVRSEAVDPTHPLHLLRQQLERAGQWQEIALEPLSATETADLAAHLANEETNTTAESLHRHTEGNPLFIVESIRAGLYPHTGKEPSVYFEADAAVRLPSKVLAMLRYRLDQLSPPARALAECAAVLGREFRYDLIATTCDQDEDAVIQGLDELWRRRIVREQGADAYDFSHDLLRQVAYSHLGSARRRQLHRRAAEALVLVYGDNAEGAGQIAVHFEQAGDLRQAADHYRRAAEAAQAVFVHVEAIRIYQNMLSRDMATILGVAEKCDILFALATSQLEAERRVDAEQTARVALADATSCGDSFRVAKAQSLLAQALGWLGHHEEAWTLLIQARATFEKSGERKELIFVLRELGELAIGAQDWGLARELTRADLHVARELGDCQSIVQAMNALCHLHWRLFDPESLLAGAREALTLAERIDDKPGMVLSMRWIGQAHEDDHAEKVRWMLRAGLLARQIGYRNGVAYTVAQIAKTLADHGQLEYALAAELHSIHSDTDLGDDYGVAFGLFSAGRILQTCGRLDEAETQLRTAIALTEGIGLPRRDYVDWHMHLASVLAERGSTDEAAQALAKAEAVAETLGGMTTYNDQARFLALLDVRIRAAQGLLDAPRIQKQLDALLPGATWPLAGEIVYWRSRLVDTDANRCAALSVLREGYNRFGYSRMQRRHVEITGESLPPAPSLPDVSALIPPPSDLDALLTEFNALATGQFESGDWLT